MPLQGFFVWGGRYCTGEQSELYPGHAHFNEPNFTREESGHLSIAMKLKAALFTVLTGRARDNTSYRLQYEPIKRPQTVASWPKGGLVENNFKEQNAVQNWKLLSETYAYRCMWL